MFITRRELPILILTLLYIALFTLLSLQRHNYEFLLYSCVVVAAVGVMLMLHRFIGFSRALLWGMSGYQ